MGEPECVEQVKVGIYEGQVVERGGQFFAQVKSNEPIEGRGPAFERCVDMVEKLADPNEFKRAKGRIECQIKLFQSKDEPDG